MNIIEQVIIIGSGPAGLTAAMYLARFGFNPVIIDGPRPGGQLVWTSYIENWPGIPKIRGIELIKNLRDHATIFGARTVPESVVSIKKMAESLFMVTTDKSNYQTRAIIIASGAHPRRLGCPGEEEYWGRGVSSCAICDGSFFKNQPVVVIGGGNSALENAFFLRQYTDQITIVHRGEKFSATEEKMLTSIKNDPAFTCLFNSTVKQIVGNGATVTGIEISTATKTQLIKTAAVFIAIGQVPSSDFVRNTIELAPHGTVMLKNETTETSVPGIFAAGDVTDARYKQAITAAAAGCMAALDVQKYLTK